MDDPNKNVDQRSERAPLEDLRRIVGKIRFSARHADYRETETWSVYAHPWPGQRAGFDALITIRPRSGSPGPIRGHQIVLRESERVYLPEEPTNRHGQIWFRGLPEGEYQAELPVGPIPPEDAEFPSDPGPAARER